MQQLERGFCNYSTIRSNPFRKQKGPPAKRRDRKPYRVLFLVFSGIWCRIVRQPRQIIHAGVQGQGDLAALLKGIVPLAALYLGIVALVDTGQHLHLDLGVSTFLPYLFQS